MRRRVFFVIGLTLLAMVLVIAAAARLVLMRNLLDLERRYLERDVERVRAAVAEDLDALARTARDWSAWDDTYAFVATRSPAFVEGNLADEMLADIRVNAVVALDTAGRLVQGKNAGTSPGVDLAGEVARWAADHPALLAFAGTSDSRSGIVVLPHATVLLAAWPIIDSSRTRPPRGTLLMARTLGREEVRTIGRRLALATARLEVDDDGLPAGLTGDAVVVEPFGRERVAGYGLVADIGGEAAFVVRVDEPADFREQAVVILLTLVSWVVLVGLSFGVAIVVFLERAVLSRLHALSAGVLAIGTSDEPGRRLAIAGRDEFAYLGAAIDGMLDARERSGAALARAEQRNEAFLGAVPDLLFRVDHGGTIVDARLPAGLSRLPDANLLVGRNARDLPAVFPRIEQRYIEEGLRFIGEVLSTGAPAAGELIVNGDPPRAWECRYAPIGAEEVLVLVRDVTAQRRAEREQQEEILLKEIHHRVKNNLQVITSLLDLQARAAGEPETRRLLAESRARVRSMALIHERLYGSGSEALNFAEYARDLVGHLRHSLAGDSGRVAVSVDVEDVSLDLDVAVPCGLVINELLSNALEHAFPGDRTGSVHVSLRRRPGGLLALTVADTGTGLPPGTRLDEPSTLGLRIVKILAAQIRGTVEAAAEGGGTAITLLFPEPTPTARP